MQVLDYFPCPVTAAVVAEQYKTLTRCDSFILHAVKDFEQFRRGYGKHLLLVVTWNDDCYYG